MVCIRNEFRIFVDLMSPLRCSVLRHNNIANSVQVCWISTLKAETRRIVETSTQTAAVRSIADLRSPQTWYPHARRMKRKWVAHIGPTNSGKTYQALLSLASARNGVYCGPLRLLAWEIHEKLCDGAIDGKKVPCDLLTGQEKILFPNSQHCSSTIEMIDLKFCVDVAVVDEVRT